MNQSEAKFRNVQTVDGVDSPEKIPNVLEIRGGKVVLKEDGAIPVFDLPDGTEVNICIHSQLRELYADYLILRHFGA